MPSVPTAGYSPTEKDLHEQWLYVKPQFTSMLPSCYCTCEQRLISIWPQEYVAYADTPQEIDRLDTLDLVLTVLKVVVYPNQYKNAAHLDESVLAAAQTLGAWKKYFHCEMYREDGTLINKALWKPTIRLSHPGMVKGSNIRFQFKPFEELVEIIESKMQQCRFLQWR